MSNHLSFIKGLSLAAGILLSQLAVAQTQSLPASAPTPSTCEARAVSKDGKPLAGAAKAAFIKKCEADAKGAAEPASGCADKAVDKNGKPLAGAAKSAFMKKCEADFSAGK
jgi:hypothetical protein